MLLTVGIQWLIIGAICFAAFGFFLAALLSGGERYDVTLSEALIDDLRKENASIKDQLRKATLEFQALVLADEFYHEMSHRKNRLTQLRFEMLYIENDFTKEWSSRERAEIAHVCDRMLDREETEYKENHQEKCPVVIELGEREICQPQLAAGGIP